ncbi:MAG: methionyl-tRNA formyltransferase [Proteobacteria bacterium]|nr:methionyl-tRNA formyltransferase [Pseudomonadota bacterium]
MRLAFAGTPVFAARALEALHQAGHEVLAVLTQPDRPTGRGQRVQPSPVKALATAWDVPVWQPNSLKLDGRDATLAQATQQALLGCQPDALVVAAYGLLLPPWLLQLAPHGALNIHASLLPRWRGAAPIQRAIEAGDTDTGVCIMQMEQGLDTGGVWLRQALPIDAQDTAATLHDRLATLGADLMLRVLHDMASPTPSLTCQAQDASGVTYAEKIQKHEATIDWRVPAPVLARRIRAFNPAPGMSTALQGQAERLKLWQAQALAPTRGAPPGTVLAAGEQGVDVACGQGMLRVTEWQRPGGKRLPAAAFVQGNTLPVGSVLT